MPLKLKKLQMSAMLAMDEEAPSHSMRKRFLGQSHKDVESRQWLKEWVSFTNRHQP
jgi:hypothetical protein